MKAFKTLAVMALVSSLLAVNANAIGKRERGALIGAGALLLLPSMVQNMGSLFGQGNNMQPSNSYGYNQGYEPIIIERDSRPKRYNRSRSDRGSVDNRQIIIIER